MPRPDPEDLDDADPTEMPIPQTDHHAGGGAGVPPLHTVESTGTRGAALRHPVGPAPAAPRHETHDDALIGGLTTLQVVAAVSLGAVLAAGIAAAVVAVLGDDNDEDDDEPAARTPARKRRAAAASARGTTRVKKKASRKAPTTRRRAEPASAERLNINEADVRALAGLPGLGPATATAILARRPFASVDDLRAVPGIGPSLLQRLKPRVAV